MARPHGTIKPLDIGELVSSGIAIASDNSYEFISDIENQVGMNIITIKSRLKESGFELVQIWAIRKQEGK